MRFQRIPYNLWKESHFLQNPDDEQNNSETQRSALIKSNSKPRF